MLIAFYIRFLLGLLQKCTHPGMPFRQKNINTGKRRRILEALLIIILLCLIIQPTNAQISTAGTSRIFVPVQDGPTDVGEEVLPYAPRRLSSS